MLAWARTCFSSPTDGSPAARPVCASVTWRPRPSTPARSPSFGDGDPITLDVANRTLEVEIDDDELARRKDGWAPLPPRYTTGVLAKYRKLVSSAAEGAVCG